MAETCPGCGSFFNRDQMGGMVTDGCPNCGRPFMDQPTPLHSEMDVRNMPAPGQGDMGGNPLQEGILADGGWQNRQKRDESFASTHMAGENLFQEYHWVMDQLRRNPELEQQILDPNAPYSGDVNHAQLGLDAIDPRVLDKVREQIQTGGNANFADFLPDTEESPVQMQSIMDMHEQVNRRQPPQPKDKLDQILQENRERAIDFNKRVYTPNLSWEPGQPGRGILIGGGRDGPVLHHWPFDYNAPRDAPMHSEYIRNLGIDPSASGATQNMAQFYLDPQGNIERQSSQVTPEQVDDIKRLDPRIDRAPTEFTFSRMSPHSSWLHMSEAEFQMENADVIPPGPPTIEATSPVLHFGNLMPMQAMGVRVNGQPLDQNSIRELMNRSFAGEGGPQPQTVTLSHEDPEALEIARKLAESGGNEGSNEAAMWTGTRNQGSLDVGDELAPNVHGALGAFGTYVRHPETEEWLPYAQRHEDLRPLLRGPVNFASGDPDITQAIQDFATSGDPTKLKELQQRRASVREAGIFDSLSKGFNDVTGFIGQHPLLVGAGIASAALPFAAPELLGAGAAAEGADVAAGAGEAAGGGGLLSKAVSPLMNMARGTSGAAEETGGLSPQLGDESSGLLGRLKGIGTSSGSLGNSAKNYLALHGASNMVQQQMAPPPNVTQTAPPPNLTYMTHKEADFDHPSSKPFPQDTDDPEHVDPHGDTSQWGYDPTVNGTGGTDSVHSLQENFPHLLYHALSPESGWNDPHIQALHQALEAESPGYLNEGDENLTHALLDQFENQLNTLHQDPDVKRYMQHHAYGPAPMGPTGVNPGHVPMTPQPGVSSPVPDQAGQTTCPGCGAPISPGATTCAACGSGTGQTNNMAAPQSQMPGQLPPPRVGQDISDGFNEPELRDPAQPIPQSDFSATPCPHCGYSLPTGSSFCPHCRQSPFMSPGGTVPGQQQGAPPMPGAMHAKVAAEPLFPPCKNCGQVAGFRNYPFANGHLECNHCGHLETAEGLAGQFNTQGLDALALPETEHPLGPHTGADHPGPHNSQQFAAVAEYLKEQGREDEVPYMLENPWLYGDEMAIVQQKGIHPPVDDTQQQQQIPQPAQEEAPPESTMPMPGMSTGPQQAMMSAVERYSTPDSFTPRCPKCHSGTTGIASEDGDCLCHACGNVWKKDVTKDMATSSSFQYLSEEHHHQGEGQNVMGVPAADQERPREGIQDNSLTWTDDAGNPLRKNQTYEMYSDKYDIPDIVRITSVKPDSIEVTLIGEYGLESATEISPEEKDLYNYHFVPTDLPPDERPNGQDQQLGADEERTAPGETSDLSQPHVMMTKVKEALTAKDFRMLADMVNSAPVEDKQALAEHVAKYLGGTNPLFDAERFMAAATGNPQTKRDVWTQGPTQEPPYGQGDPRIGHDSYPSPEDYTALNAGPADEREVDGYGAPLQPCHVCGKPRSNYEACQSCGDASHNPYGPVEHDLAPYGPAWQDEQRERGIYGKQAGAKFTPMEQREFIDEQGEARNRDKLRLEGTHYMEEEWGLDDSSLFM